MKPIVWIAFIVVLIISVVGTQWYKRSTFNKLLKCLQNQDFDKFFTILDSLACKYFFAPFNREHMRLNAFFMMGDSTKIREQFDLILNMRINKKQRLDVCMKAFYFYVDEEDKVKAKEILDRMQGVTDETLYEQCNLIYENLLLKKTDYIDVMEEHVKACEPGFDRGMFHYLLALQYSYLDQKKKEMEHLRIAKTDMKDTPYETKINKMIKGK